MTIAEKIRQQRRLVNISQDELSKRAGVSLKTIQRWEAAQRSPRMEEIQKLAEVLKVPVSELLSDSPTPAPVMQVIPTQEKSTQEKNTGMLTITFENGRKIEVPATPEGYAFLREVASAPAPAVMS